jgi:two-component system sensor histidine kinase GlrK
MALTDARAKQWTLGAALALSHGALTLALVATIALGALSLRRIDHDLRELRDDKLGAIDEQQALHRAMWAVEVAMRHAEDACNQDAPEEAVRPPLQRALQALRDNDRHVGPHVGPEMRRMGLRYEDLAQSALDARSCQVLRSSEARAARNALDEQLTDLWIAQSFELHKAIAEREEHARHTGRRAIAIGAGISVAIVLLVAFLARWISRSVSRPLSRIARDATRLGRGDFAPIEPVDGPLEVAELADELERMRHALAALDALKEGFVASVSHELRTPLAKIREALALLEDGAAGELEDKQRSLVAIAKRACEAQIRLVSNLLDLSRLRAGSVVLKHAEGSLVEVVREAIDQEREDAARRSIQLDFEPPDTAAICTMDAALVERAVANLVRNAVQVSPSNGRVRVLMTMHTTPPSLSTARGLKSEARWACVRVEDEGPGVSEEDRSTLFDPFVSRSVGESARVGVGLGLTLCREVARAHGGEARWVETPNGERGARFELWLPLDRE